MIRVFADREQHRISAGQRLMALRCDCFQRDEFVQVDVTGPRPEWFTEDANP
jgi:hypothetical protein